MHCILELYGCPSDLIDDERFLRKAVEQAATHGLSTLIRISSHKFEPQGVTAIGLLAESHLSIHTWPEHGYAAVDIFTCGRDARPQSACAFLVEHLSARHHVLKVLHRGTDAIGSVPAFSNNASPEVELCRARN
jgi:S-adenosylmethionine decarboxylase